jgi:hypothetical protein
MQNAKSKIANSFFTLVMPHFRVGVASGAAYSVLAFRNGVFFDLISKTNAVSFMFCF